MKKLVKALVLFVVLAMVFSLVACGSSNSQGDSTTAAVTAAQTEQATAAATTAAATTAAAAVQKSGPKDLFLSVNDTPAKQLMLDLAKAMQDVYTDGKIVATVYPAARALETVKNGEADLMLPYGDPKGKIPGVFSSSETLYSAIFVLYTNVNNKDINATNAYNYKIEVHPAHGMYFNNMPESDVDGGFQKVEAGRIDGYITSQTVGDDAIKRLGLKNIKRWNFMSLEVKALFADNDTGKAKEQIFTDLIKKVKDNGKFQEILAPKLAEKYNENP